MKEQLIYCIADHIIKVNTSNKEMTRSNMPTYEPFLVSQDACDSSISNHILFEISGDLEISTPESANLLDKGEYNDGEASIFYDNDFYYVEIETSKELKGIMKASKNWKVVETNLSFTKLSDSILMKSFFMMAYVMASAPLKTLKVHASVIEKDGNALLFLGKSGTGKSTHSKLWLKHVPGCSLLNDDTPIVRVLSDGSIRAYGAPWSGSTHCYRNKYADIKAFVHLYQHPENKLSKLNAIQATSSLMESSGTMRFNQENLNHVFNTVSDILQSIPVYRLDCRPDKEAVELTRKLLNA